MRLYGMLILVFVMIGLLPWMIQPAFSAIVYSLIFLIYTSGRFFMYALAALPAVYILRNWTRKRRH